jgi:zinc protease
VPFVKRIAVAFALLGAAFAFAAPASAALKATQYTLKNGMEVVVIPDHRAPVVTHMLWYRVGGVDDPMGHSGLAHFFEHMMFKGTRRVPGNQLTLTVARNGGQSNAFTSHDYTAYFERIAKDRLGLMMELEADRMRNLILNDEGVKTERDVVLEERRLRIESDPSSIMGEQLQAALYMSHPYGRPVIGWSGEIARIGRAEAQAYYDRHYAPNNAILIVAGDVEPEDVLKLAERTYGRLARRDLEPRMAPVVPPRLGEARIAFSHPDAKLPTLMRVYRVPSYVTDARAAEALQLLAEYLGGGPTSRLYRILVIDRKLAVGAGAYYSGVSRGSAEFSVYAYPAPGVSFDKIEAAMDAIITEAGAKAPLPEAFERSKTVLVADAIYSRDSQDAMANDYGQALVVGLTTKDVEEWPGRIKAVTAARMQEAARRYLIRSESATGRLSPQPPPVPATAGASPAEGAP